MTPSIFGWRRQAELSIAHKFVRKMRRNVCTVSNIFVEKLGMRPKNIRPSQREKNCATAEFASEDRDWIDQEAGASRLADLRLERLFAKLLGQMSEHFGAAIPMACRIGPTPRRPIVSLPTNASMKRTYWGAFCFHPRARGLRGSPILVLHDTTEFSFRREKEIGMLHRTINGQNSWGKLRRRTMCGLLIDELDLRKRRRLGLAT